MKKPYCITMQDNNHKFLRLLAAEKYCRVGDVIDILVEELRNKTKKQTVK
jgi:hypothetical protein